MSIIFVRGGKKRAGEYASCAICSSEFIRPTFVAKGKNKKACCSSECTTIYRKRNQITIVCQSCGISVSRQASHIKNSISGLHFCSVECKTKEHKIGGLISPTHYGTASTGTPAYWKIAAENHPVKCVDCGLDYRPLLVVHHIDGSNKNNSPENLEFVCHFHHTIRHMKFTDKWIYNSKELTPRDCISQISELVRNISNETVNELKIHSNCVVVDNVPPNSFSCPVCNKSIKRCPSSVKSSKSGIFCCSILCKSIVLRGECKVPGFEKIARRYVNGFSAYGKCRNDSSCADCGMNYKPLLVVHHIDGNRKNGKKENLEVLCHLHHALRHFKYDEDKSTYVYSGSHITLRDDLDKIRQLFKFNF